MREEYSIEVEIKKGSSQFIDSFSFLILKDNFLCCTISGGIFDWKMANKLNTHPYWIKNQSSFLEKHFSFIFDDQLSTISLNNKMSDIIFFENPLIFIEKLISDSPSPSDFMVFIGAFIRYFEDKVSIALFSDWKNIGVNFNILISETISMFNVLGICIQDENLAIRFMESKKTIDSIF